MATDLDSRLKLADPDRWLATRFISDPLARADVVALYALDLELGAVPQRATNPLMAEIRLAWWRERCEALAEGGTGGEHPVLTGLSPALAHGRIPLAAVEAMIAARHAELADPWFEDEAALDLYLDDLDVSLLSAVATRLDAAVDREAVAPAARLCGLARLAHRPAGEGSAPPWWPRTWRDLGPSADDADDVIRHLGHKLGGLQQAARTAPRLSPAAFPAITQATLALDPGRGPLGRRLRMMLAVARGRI